MRGTDMDNNSAGMYCQAASQYFIQDHAKLLTCHVRALNVALTGSANSAAVHGAATKRRIVVENPSIQSPDPCSTQHQLASYC